MPLAPNVPPQRRHLTWLVVVAVLVAGLVVLGLWGQAIEGAPAAEIETSSGTASALDERGNPTFAALMLDDGEGLDTELASHGWSWDDDQRLYASRDGSHAYYVMGPDDHEYTQEELLSLDANGGDEPVMLCLLLDDADYDSAIDVIEALGEGLDVRSANGQDGRHAAALVTDGDASDVAWVSWDGDDGLWRVYLLGEAGIRGGVAESYLWWVSAESPEQLYAGLEDELDDGDASGSDESDSDGGLLDGLPVTNGRPLSGDPTPTPM